MSDITAKIIWMGGLKFTGRNSDDLETVMDGDRQAGASPVELLLESLGACPSTFIVKMLKKMREPFSRLEISLEANRHSPEPRFITAVRAQFDVWGEGLNPDKVMRAIGLSFAKYCSVYHSLRPDMEFQVEYRIHEPGIDTSDAYKPIDLRAMEI